MWQGHWPRCVRLVHDIALFNNHLRDAIVRFGLTSLFCDSGPGRHHHVLLATIITLMLSMRGAWKGGGPIIAQ